MKKLLLFLGLSLFHPALRSQELCGFDYLLNQVLSDSTTQSNFDSIRAAIRNQINITSGTHMVTQPNTYVIPVVFHVIGDGTSAALTDAQIITQLQILNDGFSNSLGSTYGVADDAQITFCLAQNTPTGAAWATFGSTTNGITRISSAAAITVSNNHHMEALTPNGQQSLTNVIYFDPSRYLNIWIVNSISRLAPPSYSNVVLGYSPFPLMSGPPNQFLDGVVMRSDVVGFTSHPRYNQGRILIHEVGHYLGLFHTFQFACNEVTAGNPCNLDGDECCDTPPVAASNQNDCIILGTPNSCFEIPDINDMIENHMDYAYDNINTCRNTFTDDQANRMHATIQVYRSVLVSYTNLLQTGVLCLPPGLNPTFLTNQPGGSTQFCTGIPYGFITAPGATTYSWTFPGGTPSTSAIQNPTGIIWSASGVYNVSLTVTDGSGGSASSTQQVFVSNCTPITGSKANWYFGWFCALSFSSGAPTAISPSSINTAESSATVSNNLGNLIFYSDGRRVYDPTHTAILGSMNGSPNDLTRCSNAKGTVIVPRPSSSNFYIFPTSDVPNVTTIGNGISMYEYNTTTNSFVSTIPIHPTENYATTEPIVAIPHCNGQDYWIVVKPVNNNQTGLLNAGPSTTINTQIASYLVTNAGVANNPVLSNSGAFVPPAVHVPGNNWIGTTAVSPDKKMIAFTDWQGAGNCYVYYFDCGNGMCEYITTLPGGIYGASFSPNSEILYVNQLSGRIRQYDLSSLSLCSPNPPFIEFDYIPTGTTLPPSIFYSMQLGPDNKIYVARNGSPFFNPQQNVAVINFPDMINLSSTSNECGYNFNGVPLLPSQFCRADLPNDIISFVGANPTDFSFCVTACSKACFTNLGCGMEIPLKETPLDRSK